MRGAAVRLGRLLGVALVLLGSGAACAHDEKSPAAGGGSVEASGPDRLEAALAPAEGGEKAAETGGASAPHPGKLERLQERRRVSRYEAATGGGEADDEDKRGEENELVRLEADSHGTPGLVLVRAMDGAQKLGYTVLELDERDYYFIALKNPSFLEGIVGSGRGVCKIAVGTESAPGGETTKVALKARAGTSAARPYCQKDLEKILRYARGELIDRPKKRERPPWLRNDEP